MEKPKWILFKEHGLDPEFRMGRVEFHKDLIPANIEKVYGGGWWYLTEDKEAGYLFDGSVDFGQIRKEDIPVLNQAIQNNARPSVSNLEWYITFESNKKFYEYTSEFINPELKPKIEFIKL